ncbi:MAG TPA: hypothetical protein V6D19_07435 [Stenomitos sp.]
MLPFAKKLQLRFSPSLSLPMPLERQPFLHRCSNLCLNLMGGAALILGISELFMLGGQGVAQANQVAPTVDLFALGGQSCPSSLNTLAEWMLPDLPSYINRVRTRAGIGKSYVLLAARPEFQPLPLSIPHGQDLSTHDTSVQQLFFTTLMRSYERDRIVQLQEYHWLFLTRSPQAWQLLRMYSTIGVYPAKVQQPPLAPRNSIDGSVGTAVKEWLANCALGFSSPPRPFPSKIRF